MEDLWTKWHEKHSDKIQLVAGIDCWIWSAGHGGNGYGRVRYAGQPEFAHRASYTEAYGPIPSGKVVRHMCGVRYCVRPDHLKLGTSADNAKDTALMFQTRSPLNIHEVRGIRAMYNEGVTLAKIAEEYGIAYGSVYPIVMYKSFQYVDPDEKGKHKMRLPRKLTYDDVTEIKRLYKSGVAQKEIGKMYDVGSSYISRVVCGYRWKNHV